MLRLVASAWQAIPCLGALLLVSISGGPLAWAQALPTGVGPGAYLSVGGTYSAFKSDYGSQTINGGSVYVDSNFVWRYGLETEARRMNYPNFGERQTTLLSGLRWSFRPKGFVPYAKVLVGGGRFDFPYGFGYGNYFVVAPGAGVDFRVGEKVRLRLLDFEYQEWPGFTFGTLHPYGVSMGLSYQVLGSSRTKMSR